MSDRFTHTSRLIQLIDLEAYILLATLGLITYAFYRFFLKRVSLERHRNLKEQFKNIHDTKLLSSKNILMLIFSYAFQLLFG